MDITNVNVGSLYRLVRNVESNDTQAISPLDGGGWTICQVKELSVDQRSRNTKFRNDLFDTLKGMAVNEEALVDLRKTLGIPEKMENAKADEPLLARNIKDAIELVMNGVDKRIGEVLKKPFPPGVQQLIREAVRANPLHEVVKSFLRTEGGTVDNLARLCRLAFQYLKGAADTRTLAYLDGFAYTVRDVSDVLQVNSYDKGQYDAGKAHYDSEVRGAGSKEGENVDSKPNDTEPAELDFDDFCNKLGKTIGSDNTSVPGFVDALRNAKDFYKSALVQFVKDCQSLALNRETAQAGCLEALLKALASEVKQRKSGESTLASEVKQQKGGDAELASAVFYKACDTATYEFGRTQALCHAAAQCEAEIKRLGEGVSKAQTDNNEVRARTLQALSDEVKDLGTKDNSVYSRLCETYFKATEKFAGQPDKVDQVRRCVTEELRTIIASALYEVKDPESAKPQKVERLAKYTAQGVYQKNQMLLQGKSELCYLRSIENALIAQGKGLPVPDEKGTYTFKLNLPYFENKQSVTFSLDIRVTSEEIKEARTLYAQGDVEKEFSGCKERYEKQKNDLQDLDVAINIAMAKRQCVKDCLDERGAVAAKQCQVDFGEGGLKKAGFVGILGEFDLTASNYDVEVAEFLGLTSEPENIAINHSGREYKNLGLPGFAISPPKEDIILNFNRVRKWMAENPEGVLTLNEAGRHFVAITGFYRNSDEDFGFIVRDSNKTGEQESTVNVFKYYYDGSLSNDKDADKKCHILNVHCYPAPAKPAV